MSVYEFHTLKNGIRLVHKKTSRIAAHCGVFINLSYSE